MPISDALPAQLKSLITPWYHTARRYWLYHKPKPIHVIHDYWHTPDAVNDPHTYLSGEPRSKFLVNLLQKYVPADGSVLELGCNVGRNLNQLYQAGYRNLEAIEINPDAIRILKQNYPAMAEVANIHVGLIENYIRSVGLKDCIFTMAVLVHIHPASDWIFTEIAKNAKTLIVIEGEKGASWRHFARNYQKLFENLGMVQMEDIDCAQIPELIGQGTEHYVARVFQRSTVQA